jgi:hypothetical protein
VYYYVQWQEARDEEWRRIARGGYYDQARNAFIEPLRAGRIDEAYAATSADFQRRISREQFGELARRYEDFRRIREERHRGWGAGVSSGGGVQTEREYGEVAEGQMIIVSWTMRRDPDSFFFPNPPPVHVDDFTVEERAGPPQGGLLGTPFGPKR